MLTRYPFQANLHGLPPEVVKECLHGRHRGQGRAPEARRGARRRPKNFEDFCLKKFGAGISRHFMIPYNQKLWGVHPREITAAWCSRFVPLPNLEQVVAGAVGAGPPEMGYNVSFLYPKAGGIETLTRALLTRMRTRAADACTGARAPTTIDWRRRDVVVGRRERAVPRARRDDPAAGAARAHARSAARDRGGSGEPALHDGALPERRLAREAARRLPLDLRAREKYPFYRVNVFSTAMPAMAPPGRGSIYVELSDRGPIPRGDDMRDVARARRGRRDHLARRRRSSPNSRRSSTPTSCSTINYYSATRAIFSFLEANGIYPRGRYGSWTYNAMEDCVLAGREVARCRRRSAESAR